MVEPGGTLVDRSAWRMLAVLMAMNIAAYLDRSVLALAAPSVQADLGLNHFELSLLLGFGFVLSFVLLGIPSGWLVDRVPRRPVVMAGIVLWSVSASCVGLARGFGAMLAARIGVGAGEAALNPAAYSLIADSFPKRRLTLALTLYGGASGIGAAVSVAVGGLLLGYGIAHGPFDLPLLGLIQPWQWMLLLSGLPGLVLAPTIMLVPEPQRHERLAGQAALGFARFLLDNWRFYGVLILGFSMFQITAYSFASWHPTYMVQRFGWSISDTGLWLSIGAAMSFVGAFCSGWIVDWWVARGREDAPLRWAVMMALWSALVLGLAFVVTSPWLCVVLVAIAQTPISLIGIVATAIQRVTPNDYRGRVSSLLLLFSNLIGFGLGPMLPALLADHVFPGPQGLGQSIALVAVITGPIAAVLIALACRPMRECLRSASSTPGEADG